MKMKDALEALGNAGNRPRQRAAKSAVPKRNLSKQAKNRTSARQAVDWKELCPELAKLEKTLESANPISKIARGLNDSAKLLNRWGRADAHTLKWMEDQALARIRIDEEFARVPTDLGRPDLTTLAVQKQVRDDDFVLDQGCSTGQTDRLLREQDRETIAKAHGEAGVSLRSEYGYRNRNGELDGPLSMGFVAASDLDQ